MEWIYNYKTVAIGKTALDKRYVIHSWTNLQIIFSFLIKVLSIINVHIIVVIHKP
jgi:hypothetical protein